LVRSKGDSHTSVLEKVLLTEHLLEDLIQDNQVALHKSEETPNRLIRIRGLYLFIVGGQGNLAGEYIGSQPKGDTP
jgi:hypothetical protein